MIPLIFIGGTLWVVGSARGAVTTLGSIVLKLTGLPVYALWRRMARQ